MKNNFVIDGELISFETKASDKLAIGKIKNTQTSKGQNYVNVLDVNFWNDSINTLKNTPLGSTIEVEGRLKNDEYQYDGRTISKLKLNCTKCSVLHKFTNTSAPTAYESVNEIPF